MSFWHWLVCNIYVCVQIEGSEEGYLFSGGARHVVTYVESSMKATGAVLYFEVIYHLPTTIEIEHSNERV